jgi:hypothetical protein
MEKLAQMYTSSWIGISIQMSSLGRFYKHFLTFLYKTRNKQIFASWTKATLLRIYFRNLPVQRSFLQYKSQCLKKVNVKYVINRLWHEIFHIVPSISPRPISALQLRCWAWYAHRVSWSIVQRGLSSTEQSAVNNCWGRYVKCDYMNIWRVNPVLSS